MDSLLRTVSLWGTQFIIKLSEIKKKDCSYLCNNLNFSSLNESKNRKVFLRLHEPPDFTNVSETKRTYLPTPCFSGVLLCMQCFFFHSLMNRDFLLLG